MIPASQYVRTHSRADVALLFKLWAEGLSAGEIASRMGVSVSTIQKWSQRYNLPKRTLSCQTDAPVPTPEDDAASLAGLALSPWVEERAKVVRERHYAERRQESPDNACSKVSKWQSGKCLPRGFVA